MSVKVIVNDKECELKMDFDAVVQYEEEHPDWSINKAVYHAVDSKRITELNLIVSFLQVDGERIDRGYVDCLNAGFKVDDMMQALRDGLEYLGFISVADPSAE